MILQIARQKAQQCADENDKGVSIYQGRYGQWLMEWTSAMDSYPLSVIHAGRQREDFVPKKNTK